MKIIHIITIRRKNASESLILRVKKIRLLKFASEKKEVNFNPCYFKIIYIFIVCPYIN